MLPDTALRSTPVSRRFKLLFLAVFGIGARDSPTCLWRQSPPGPLSYWRQGMAEPPLSSVHLLTVADDRGAHSLLLAWIRSFFFTSILSSTRAREILLCVYSSFSHTLLPEYGEVLRRACLSPMHLIAVAKTLRCSEPVPVFEICASISCSDDRSSDCTPVTTCIVYSNDFLCLFVAYMYAPL